MLKSKTKVPNLQKIPSRDQLKSFRLSDQKNILPTPKIHKSIPTSTNVDKETEIPKGESVN
jgi:hypothetical protein